MAENNEMPVVVGIVAPDEKAAAEILNLFARAGKTIAIMRDLSFAISEFDEDDPQLQVKIGDLLFKSLEKVCKTYPNPVVMYADVETFQGLVARQTLPVIAANPKIAPRGGH